MFSLAGCRWIKMRHDSRPWRINPVSTHQGEAVDLHVQDLHFSIRDLFALWFVLLVGLQIGPEPLQLEVSTRIQGVVHLIQTCQSQKAHTHHHSRYIFESRLSSFFVLFYKKASFLVLSHYLQIHWSDSQCQRLGNCTQHIRSQWIWHFLQEGKQMRFCLEKHTGIVFLTLVLFLL